MTSVYDLRYAGGKLFVRVDPGPVMCVYDPDTSSWIVNKNTAYNARGFSPISPDGKTVFYTYYETLPGGGQQWSLYSYDVNTGFTARWAWMSKEQASLLVMFSWIRQSIRAGPWSDWPEIAAGHFITIWKPV